MDLPRAPQPGFTLVELLIVLAIMTIVVAAGAPTLGSVLARSHESSAEGNVADALRQARTAAVTHNSRVVVCPSDDGRHCEASADWQHGWLVADDSNHDNQPDAGKQVIAVLQAMPTGTRITTSTGRRQITFQPTGSAGGSNVTFTICHARDRSGRAVVVANSGRVRLQAADAAHLRDCLAGLR